MTAIGTRQIPPGKAVQQPPQIAHNEDLNTFTENLGPIVSRTRWQRGDFCDSIVAHGGIAWMLSGIVRKCLVLENGHRRIIDLMMPGDFVGLRPDDGRHFSFEVSTDEAVTARITRRDFDSLVAMRPLLHEFFHEGARQAIARLEDHILVQGRTTSIQKVASYLFLMSRRLSEHQGSSVVLPVTRYDIADHIGIAVETVSRAITELRRQGVIELETPRCLSMRDTHKLVDGVQDTH